MKLLSISSRYLVFCLLPTFVLGQELDETLVDRPSKEIDYPGCFSDLNKADRNGDGFVKQNEYLNFIQEYGKRICFSTDALTLQQSATFNLLACICRAQEGSDSDCCVGDNAQIPTAGALATPETRTPGQLNYLTSVCKLTDATIDGQCPPSIKEREAPPGALVKAPSEGGGLSDGAMWGIIAAALLLFLLLCCCCCVWRKKKQKQQEEEEEEERRAAAAAKRAAMMEPEQAPEPPPGPHLLRKTGIDPVNGPVKEQPAEEEAGPGIGASGATEAEDSDEDEDGRKRRGGGNIPGEDEETGLRVPTAPQLPPPEDPENPGPKLNPIEPEPEEDEEWDHAGRNLDMPRDKDEMSAGEVEHYEPDGGVYFPEREGKEPSDWRNKWNRQKPDEPDEVDPRKHRIQAGLGEGEVWDKLNEADDASSRNLKQNGDVFDWVVQSALGALEQDQDREEPLV